MLFNNPFAYRLDNLSFFFFFRNFKDLMPLSLYSWISIEAVYELSHVKLDTFFFKWFCKFSFFKLYIFVDVDTWLQDHKRSSQKTFFSEKVRSFESATENAVFLKFSRFQKFAFLSQQIFVMLISLKILPFKSRKSSEIRILTNYLEDYSKL